MRGAPDRLRAPRRGDLSSSAHVHAGAHVDEGAHVDPGASLGEGVRIGAGAVVGAGALLGAGTVVEPCAVLAAGVRIEANSVIGAGAVIQEGCSLGEGCVVEPCAVLGKRPRLRPGSGAAGAGGLPGLELAGRVTVCAGAVLYAGARVGARAILGDQCQVRERARIGEATVLGRGSCVDFGARVGARVLIQTGVYLCAATLVEDDVFVGPGVQSANDDTMDRHPPGEPLRGATLRRACRIGAGAVLVPGVEVGEEAFVAAGAVVVRDVPARAVVMGVPARVAGKVPDEQLLERWR